MDYGDSRKFHNALLRPAVMQILRAAGFQSARPFVVDSLTDIAGLYIQSLAEMTAQHSFTSRNEAVPNVTDVRMALAGRAAFSNLMGASEEAWRETLRRPLADYPEQRDIRAGESRMRDAEDTRDVRDFMDWFEPALGKASNEVRRVAGHAHFSAEAGQWVEGESREDFVAMLKKKHSKTGEESKFQGTVLGIDAEEKPVKIEGGVHETIADWVAATSARSVKLAAMEGKNGVDEPAAKDGAESDSSLDELLDELMADEGD